MFSELLTKAYQILDGAEFPPEFFYELAENLPDEEILDLASLANKVKNKFCPVPHVCTIMNVKSGKCTENCRFCSQSGHHKTAVEVYPLISAAEMVEKARETYNHGVKHFGLVTSGHGYLEDTAEFREILSAIDTIKKELPELNVCASVGMLSESNARALADHGILHSNINLQTSTEKYRELIATTHTHDEKKESIKHLQKYGVQICCGGILGLSENLRDRVNLAFTLKEMNIDIIPLNVLIPIEGTPLEGQPPVSVAEIAKSFALFRLINPTKSIKFAAGRETRMKDFQGLLLLAGVNGFLTGGYLTTRGREVSEDRSLFKELLSFGSVYDNISW